MSAILNPVTASCSIVEIEVGGILFDMDGVLVRSTSGDERCWARWAKRNRLTDSFDLKKTHGRRAADTIRENVPHITEAELKQHLSDLDAFAEEEQIDITAIPGARELLQSIPSHRWTVVTSASERMMRSRLASVGIISPRSAVGGDRVTRGKPDPEGYLRGAALLSRSPHDCLVVEDAPAGIQAGRSAGCQVLAVASSHAIEELRHADWIVASLDQIQLSVTDSATLKLRFPAFTISSRSAAVTRDAISPSVSVSR